MLWAGQGVITDSDMTPFNARIFALGIDAWMPEGGLVASSAWEDRSALASALGLILCPSDRLGVYLCVEPRQSLASAPTKSGSRSILPSPHPLSAHYLWHLTSCYPSARQIGSKYESWGGRVGVRGGGGGKEVILLKKLPGDNNGLPGLRTRITFIWNNLPGHFQLCTDSNRQGVTQERVTASQITFPRLSGILNACLLPHAFSKCFHIH